ncbi:MAG: glycerophosphodiester phosphodiesterase family protein [Planctomycetota bacterium]
MLMPGTTLQMMVLSLFTLVGETLAQDFPDWTSAQPGRVSLEDGTLRLTSPSANDLTRVAFPGPSMAGGRAGVSARFLSVQDDSRWLSLIARAKDDRQEPYLQLVCRRAADGDSGLEIARRENGRWIIVTRGRSEKPMELGEWFRLELELAGPLARGYLNGELVLEAAWHGATLDEGLIGLQVSGGEAEFRELVVEPALEADDAEDTIAPLFVAHRGHSILAPENTLASIEAAIEAGFPATEFDVRQTSDGQLVLFHDDKLGRTTDWTDGTQSTNGDATPELLRLASFEQVRRLDAGSWKDERYRGERVPTLREALEACRGRILPVVEIKDDDIGAAVARQIVEAGVAGEVLVISFRERALGDVFEAAPEIPTALLDGDVPAVITLEHVQSLIARARRVGANALDLSYRWITPEAARAIRARGLGLLVYTVNDPEHAKYLTSLGVTSITTDGPGRFAGR